MNKYARYFAVILICFFSILIVPHPLFAGIEQLKPIIQNIENDLNATIGVAVYDTKANSTWAYNGDKSFPLMSTAKVLVCAYLLAEVDAKKFSLEAKIMIMQGQIVTYSPVMEKHVNTMLSLKDICSATLSISDNSAMNILLDQLGGPTKLTAFMRSIDDSITRLDRKEPALNEAMLDDVRDTTTPQAMVSSLNSIFFAEVLSHASKVQLMEWMKANKVSGALTRSVLPQDWKIADRSGAGGFGSRGIVAILWPPQKQPIIICIYLKQTGATLEERNLAIARISEAIIKIWGFSKLK